MCVLAVEHLNVTYNGKKGAHHIVRDVSFSVKAGECLCILGESGSGKSMTMKAVMGLLDNNFNVSGNILLNGTNLLKLDTEALRKIRGTQLTMILQNPMTCFDSLYRIKYQMEETFAAHTDWPREEIFKNSVEALAKMQISQPEEALNKYPHQLSGGMLQRIMIATALMLKPQVLIADEPTTAIDAITQFEIMNEFKRLKQNTTMIFITHDLGIASMIADQIIVMNSGVLVDSGTFSDVLQNPKDAYTKLLIEKKAAVMSSYKAVLGVG